MQSLVTSLGVAFSFGLIDYENSDIDASDKQKTDVQSIIETRIIDDQTAYLKIPNFLSQSIENDRNTILLLTTIRSLE